MHNVNWTLFFNKDSSSVCFLLSPSLMDYKSKLNFSRSIALDEVQTSTHLIIVGYRQPLREKAKAKEVSSILPTLGRGRQALIHPSIVPISNLSNQHHHAVHKDVSIGSLGNSGPGLCPITDHHRPTDRSFRCQGCDQ